jgi:hypothetical protein
VGPGNPAAGGKPARFTHRRTTHRVHRAAGGRGLEPAGVAGQSHIKATVTIRASITEDPVATGTVDVPGVFNNDGLDQQTQAVANALVRALVGQSVQQPPGMAFPPPAKF